MDEPRLSKIEMLHHVARFKELRGSEEAFLDSRLPNSRRTKINRSGTGVVENEGDPNLRPKIPLPALAFSLGMIIAQGRSPGIRASLRPLRRPGSVSISPGGSSN